MPLAFPSRTHGTVAFGFFNIETDMLLLEELFWFADRFCAAVVTLAEAGAGAGGASIAGWRIADRARIGHLRAAIAGVDLIGFIGATYREFPFPSSPAEFKQSPEGDRSQAFMTELIGEFGEPERFEVSWEADQDLVRIAEFAFDGAAFGKLVRYVEQGGYPRYRDEVRPRYVRAMCQRLGELSSPWLDELD